jgi:hypothetical protein
VQFDFDAVIALGAEGTPTIFINDEMIPLTSPDDIRAALDEALAESPRGIRLLPHSSRPRRPSMRP